LDNTVQVVSFSEAWESFKAVLDRVEADADVTLITRRMRPICSGRWSRPIVGSSSPMG
jgi:hypothetical protein